MSTQAENSKDALRKRGWDRVRDADAGRFPGIDGRIPNFLGAEAAADRLAALGPFMEAKTLKMNPDSPQRPVRYKALTAGKTLYMAVPKLAAEKPFIELDPSTLAPNQYWTASSIKGAFELGKPVSLEEMPKIDAIVTGCVAVSRLGERLGKGGGYSDLEYALLRQQGLISEETPIMTTVHPSQIVEDNEVPLTGHDIAVDYIATPDTCLHCPRLHTQPKGVIWDILPEAKRAAIPVLQRMWDNQAKS